MLVPFKFGKLRKTYTINVPRQKAGLSAIKYLYSLDYRRVSTCFFQQIIKFIVITK